MHLCILKCPCCSLPRWSWRNGARLEGMTYGQRLPASATKRRATATRVEAAATVAAAVAVAGTAITAAKVARTMRVVLRPKTTVSAQCRAERRTTDKTLEEAKVAVAVVKVAEVSVVVVAAVLVKVAG